jgi:DNA (cytosine-5)-methyltransferase 1
VIDGHPQGVTWHTAFETARLLAMMSPINRAKIDLVANNQRRAVGAVYKRTRTEGGRKVQRAEVRFDIAGCLRTPGGGSSRQTILIVEDGQVRSRLISVRETARLMGLPEEYRLPERYNEAYHLTGDGVAVPVVRAIANAIIEPTLDYIGMKIVAA